jgi:hypothetical protein
MGIIRCRRVRLIVRASDRSISLLYDDSSLKSVSFPAFGSLASTKTHLPIEPSHFIHPHPPNANPSLSSQKILLSPHISHTATTACATIHFTTHPNRRHASRPIASAPQLSCSMRRKRGDGYNTPRHSAPDRSQLTVDERSHVFRSQTDGSLAVVCLLACGTANASGD